MEGKGAKEITQSKLMVLISLMYKLI